MISIFCKNNSPRLNYVLKLIFSEVLMMDYTLVNDPELFNTLDSKKINYSENSFKNSLQIIPSGLLEENKITQKVIKSGHWKNLPILFVNDNGELPFDLFAAVFYMVSRYEEYLPFVPDKHRRFDADMSISSNKKFLHIPVVDIWCKLLAEELGISEECKGIQPSNYRYKLTVDIDRAWQYKNAGIFHTIALLLRDLVTFQTDKIKERINVLTGRKPDPYYTFDYLKNQEDRLKEKIRFFILCSKTGKFDKNNSLKNKQFKKLIVQLFNNSQIGIHPSYKSNETFEILQNELFSLEAIVNQKIYHSRQHFLRIIFPGTYRRLIKLGILHDHSMGFSSKSGFRAGIARPYFYYDLSAEKQTDLRIVPFQVMDRTLLTYMNLNPDEAIKEIEYYKDTIQQVGGYFIALWHNSSLSDQGEWKDWRKVFERMIDLHQKEDISSASIKTK